MSRDGHIKEVHERIKNHKCDLCNRSFSRSFVLKTHQEKVHQIGNKFKENTKCDKCGKPFTNLMKHLNTIHKPNRAKDINCFHCSKSFYETAHLNSHVREVHERTKEYKCDTCGKLFSRNFLLKTHQMKIHKNEKQKFDLVA